MDKNSPPARISPWINRLATIGAIIVVATISIAQLLEPKQNIADPTDRVRSIRASAGRR